MISKTGIASLHPIVLFIYFAGIFSLSMLFLHPVFLGTALLCVVLLNVFCNNASTLKKYLKYYILFAFIVMLVNPLFSHRGSHILFYFLDQPITFEAVIYGVTMMLSLMTILIGFIAFNLLITEDKFMFLFSSVLPKSALLTVMAMRFVPLLKRRLKEITLVQQTKGITVSDGPIRLRTQNGMKLLHILLTWSLDEVLVTADSMKARGYGLKKRSSYFFYKMDLQDKLLLSLMGILLISCFIMWMNGFGILEIYPTLEGILLSKMDIFVYFLFILFLFTPIFIEGRELIRWKYSK